MFSCSRTVGLAALQLDLRAQGVLWRLGSNNLLYELLTSTGLPLHRPAHLLTGLGARKRLDDALDGRAVTRSTLPLVTRLDTDLAHEDPGEDESKTAQEHGIPPKCDAR